MNMIAIFKALPEEAETLVLELTGRIEKLRALHPDESQLIEEAIRREKRRSAQFQHKWTTKQDTALIVRGGTRQALFKLADDFGVSYASAKARRHRLQTCKTQSGQKRSNGVGG